jgi:hypothetical protein
MIILHVIYGRETLSLMLREEYVLTVSERKDLGEYLDPCKTKDYLGRYSLRWGILNCILLLKNCCVKPKTGFNCMKYKFSRI